MSQEAHKAGVSGGGEQHSSHSRSVVTALKSRLRTFASSFKGVLETRAAALKQQQARRSAFGGGRAAHDLGKPMVFDSPPPLLFAGGAGSADGASSGIGGGRGGGGGGGALPRPHGGAARFSALEGGPTGLTPPRPAGAAASPPVPPTGAAARAAAAEAALRRTLDGANVGAFHLDETQAAALAPQGYLQDRAEAVEDIEATIVELGSIFNRLANLVTEQGEMVERIDDNASLTLSNVEAGQRELVRYFNSVRGNRWLIAKVMGVLMFFAAFFMIFLA